MEPTSHLSHYVIRFLLFVGLMAMLWGGSKFCNLRQEHLRRENTARRLQEFDEALKRSNAQLQDK